MNVSCPTDTIRQPDDAKPATGQPGPKPRRRRSRHSVIHRPTLADLNDEAAYYLDCAGIPAVPDETLEV